MSSYRTQAPSQATAWAQQRKDAIEKAKKLRDDRKYNMAMTGEMTINSYNSKDRNTDSRNATTKVTKPNLASDYSNNNSNTYGGGSYKKAATLSTIPTHEEDHEVAQSSLKLLKSKMKNYSGLSNTQNMDMIDSLTENTKYGVRGNEKGAPQRDDYGRGGSNKYQANPLSETSLPNNQNYRKVFKPTFDDDNGGYDQDYNKGSGGLNKTGPARTQAQVGRQSNIRDENKGRGFGSAQEDEYTGFSTQNVPSRIPKGTIGTNKAKTPISDDRSHEAIGGSRLDNKSYGLQRGKQEQNPYDNEYDDYSNYNENRAPSKQQVQPKQQKVYNPANYAANPSSKGYQGDRLEMPESKGPSGYQPRSRPNYQEREQEDDVKPYSKPSMQKAAPKIPSRQSARTHGALPDNDRPIKNAGAGAYEMDSETPDGSEPLVQCPAGCGRRFFESVLEKHAKACVKVFQSKRKRFDMAGQRMTEEQAQVATETKGPSKFNKTRKMEAPPGKKAGGLAASKAAKWKQESELFRANLKAARGEKLTKEEAVTVSKQQDSLTPCDYCGRRFNEEAAKRHIPYCQNKTKMDALKKGPPPKGKPTRKY